MPRLILRVWAHFRVSSQLHFARPTVYNEIYNPQNKWDKDYELYRAFDMDESFFTQTDYRKARLRRSLVSNFFSRSAISEMQHLIRDQVRSIYPLCVSWFLTVIGSVAGSILWRAQRAKCRRYALSGHLPYIDSTAPRQIE